MAWNLWECTEIGETKKSHIEHIVQVLTGPNCGKLK